MKKIFLSNEEIERVIYALKFVDVNTEDEEAIDEKILLYLKSKIERKNEN